MMHTLITFVGCAENMKREYFAAEKAYLLGKCGHTYGSHRQSHRDGFHPAYSNKDAIKHKDELYITAGDLAKQLASMHGRTSCTFTSSTRVLVRIGLPDPNVVPASSQCTMADSYAAHVKEFQSAEDSEEDDSYAPTSGLHSLTTCPTSEEFSEESSGDSRGGTTKRGTNAELHREQGGTDEEESHNTLTVLKAVQEIVKAEGQNPEETDMIKTWFQAGYTTDEVESVLQTAFDSKNPKIHFPSLSQQLSTFIDMSKRLATTNIRYVPLT
jgi:hypothetical protein